MGKTIFLFVLLICVFENYGYNTKYDDIDLDEILQSDRLLNNYVKCLVNEGPCTPDGQELKNSLPDAIATNCASCTEKQRNGVTKVNHHLIDNKPEDWDRVAALYDPDGEYKKKYFEEKEATSESSKIED